MLQATLEWVSGYYRRSDQERISGESNRDVIWARGAGDRRIEWLDRPEVSGCRSRADPESRGNGTMTYAYLFKYIIIGDTGKQRATALIAGAGIRSSQFGSWGRGSVGWAIR